MRTLAKLMMFISSFSPLYIILIILNLNVNSLIGYDLRQIIFCGVMAILLLISVISTLILVKSKGQKVYKVLRIERPNDSIIAYIMTYVIPLISLDINSDRQILANILLFCTIGFLYSRLNLLYINPTWAIFGYFSYLDSNSKIIISNIPYRKLKRMSNKDSKVMTIGDDIILLRKKDNLNITSVA